VSGGVEPGAVSDWLADRLSALQRAHVPRVAIDGPDAAGKTTFADRLADLVSGRRPVIRMCADNFLHPAEIRYRRGTLSPEGYYLDSFDNDAILAKVLSPLGPGENLVFRSVTGGGHSDAAALPALADRAESGQPSMSAEPAALLLFDGVFLQRAELRAHWDLVIYLHVAPEESLRRALVRDLPVFGSESNIERRYRLRYLPGQAIYQRTDRPLDRADIVLDMSDPARPSPIRPSRIP
jgi:uridine kinase